MSVMTTQQLSKQDIKKLENPSPFADPFTLPSVNKIENITHIKEKKKNIDDLNLEEVASYLSLVDDKLKAYKDQIKGIEKLIVKHVDLRDKLSKRKFHLSESLCAMCEKDIKSDGYYEDDVYDEKICYECYKECFCPCGNRAVQSSMSHWFGHPPRKTCSYKCVQDLSNRNSEMIYTEKQKVKFIDGYHKENEYDNCHSDDEGDLIHGKDCASNKKKCNLFG
jgi:hypothetical protein